MKALVALLLLGVVAVAADKQFDEFLSKYGKSYSGAEYHKRLRVFRENVKRAEEQNRNGDDAHYGVTKFADLTEREFRSQVLMAPQDPQHLAKACMRQGVYAPGIAREDMGKPEALDWSTDETIVTPVKNQGGCGSCWAFSTVENMEGLNGMAKNPLAGVSLSAQFLVDCSKGCSSEIYHNENTTVCNGGCGGGWPWTALDDIATASVAPVPSWDKYPYTGIAGKCKKSDDTVAATVSGYRCIGLDKIDNEDEIAEYLARLGPLSIALNADPFQSYQSGIISPKLCGKKALNHAVLLVGYGTEDGQDYWKIKNSWGEDWGEAGYVRVARGKGTCGVNEAVTCGIL
eukprot:TRINITY_DN18497_c0_g1_i1.p1 TRINITY_DN18497_c0_g1~~TRINITY_DN18497_c0_g1_i1.p1  ORF type:complete len:345 (-),score=123.82 TRINITY_DN18497_c0_g1_i1:123-1157(-)